MEAIRTIPSRTCNTVDKVAHILVPGRGRASSGRALTQAAKCRAREAARLFTSLELAKKSGVIVVCGYKSPADWYGLQNEYMEGYVGIPEADLLANELMRLGIPGSVIRVERNSIDTVTNLLFAEKPSFFPDERSVAIIAQEAHLRRIMKYIAPKILQRDYVGVIVAAPKDRDSLLATFFSQIALFGTKKNGLHTPQKVYRRVLAMWGLANTLRRKKPYNNR